MQPLQSMPSMQQMPQMPSLSMQTTPANKGKRPMRHLTAQDKVDAINRIHNGESKASVARDIGVPESTLRGWCKNEEKLKYMARQSSENAEKLTGAGMGPEYLVGAATSNKRKSDPQFFHNGKMKYDDLHRYSRAPSGLDLSGNDKRLDFSSLPMPDYAALQALNCNKNNGNSYGDMKSRTESKPEHSIPTMNPLTQLNQMNLTNLPGINLNDLATNFNFYNFASNFAALQNNLNAAQNAAASSNMARLPKTSPHSPRAENDKSPSLTVKNLSKLQKCADDLTKARYEQPKTTQDIWQWISSKSNQMYNFPNPASPQNSSPAQPMKIPTPPIATSSPQRISPNYTVNDDRNSHAWMLNMYKPAFQMEKPESSGVDIKMPIDTLLFKQLTRPEAANNYQDNSQSSTPKPEDLSSTHPNERVARQSISPNLSAKSGESFGTSNTDKAKDEIDNALYHNNNNNEESSDASPDELMEGLKQGLKLGTRFQEYLETLSIPSITALQVSQVRGVVNALKAQIKRTTDVANVTSTDEKPLKRRRK